VGTVVDIKEPTVGLHAESACAKAINENNSVENNTSIDRIAQEAANTSVIMTTGRGNQIASKSATVNSLLAMKHKLYVSSVKSVKHA